MGEYIDAYCERLEPGLLAEPVNLITNIAFIIAAWLASRQSRDDGTMDASVATLCLLLMCIGIGSGLFHSFADTVSVMMDVIPIVLFQLAFITFYTRRIMRLTYIMVTAWICGFLMLSLLFGRYDDVLNGSLGYAPAIIYLFVLASWHWYDERSMRTGLISAAALFSVSLVFRTMDMSLCQVIPLGTHFLWHLLNAIVLYLVIRSYSMNLPGRP